MAIPMPGAREEFSHWSTSYDSSGAFGPFALVVEKPSSPLERQFKSNNNEQKSSVLRTKRWTQMFIRVSHDECLTGIPLLLHALSINVQPSAECQFFFLVVGEVGRGRENWLSLIPLKPSHYCGSNMFNVQNILPPAHRMYLCLLYGSQNERLSPHAAFTDCGFYNKRSVFTVRYEPDL